MKHHRITLKYIFTIFKIAIIFEKEKFQQIKKKVKDRVTMALAFCTLWHLFFVSAIYSIAPLLVSMSSTNSADFGPFICCLTLNNGTATLIFFYKFIGKFKENVANIRHKIELKFFLKTSTPVSIIVQTNNLNIQHF